MRVLEDSRYFNCSVGDRIKEHKFDLFWKVMAEVIDIDGAGTHRRRHVSSDTQTTCNVAHAPNINSITQLIDATKKNLLEKKLRSAIITLFHIAHGWHFNFLQLMKIIELHSAILVC